MPLIVKTGIAYIDVGLDKLRDERDEREYGLPPSRQGEPYVKACWNIRDDEEDGAPETLGGGDFEEAAFDDVDAALAWARERAPIVLVRLGATEAGIYSAGERQATHELPELGGTDLTPYPEWPPADWPNTVIPPLPRAKVIRQTQTILGEEGNGG